MSWTAGDIDLGLNPALAGGSLGDGTFESDGELDIKTDNNIVAYTGDTFFVNAGVLRKEATPGTTQIQAKATDTGSTYIQTGTIEFDDGGSFSGDVYGKGALLFTGGDFRAQQWFHRRGRQLDLQRRCRRRRHVTVNEDLSYARPSPKPSVRSRSPTAIR